MEQQGQVPTGQQGYAPTGQPVESVPGPGVPIQPLVDQPRVGRIDKTYLKTALGIMRDLEGFYFNEWYRIDRGFDLKLCSIQVVSYLDFHV